MSKSWAPAPNGQPTHSTKIRVVGAEPGSPEFDAALNRHHGQIQQFIRAQHQRAELSGLPQHKSSMTLDGAVLTYNNNQGQDTVTVEVLTTSSETSEATTTSVDYFSWALVEFEIRGIVADGSAWDVMAMLSTEMDGKPVWAHQADSSGDGVFQFPDGAWAASPGFVLNQDADGIGDTQLFSLLVDLRKFQHPGGVAIDVYALASADRPADTSPQFYPFNATVSAVLARELYWDTPTQIVVTEPYNYDPTSHAIDVSFRWDDSNIFPDRHKMGVAPQQLVVQQDFFPTEWSLDNYFGLRKVGTVTLTPQVDRAGFNLKLA